MHDCHLFCQYWLVTCIKILLGHDKKKQKTKKPHCFLAFKPIWIKKKKPTQFWTMLTWRQCCQTKTGIKQKEENHFDLLILIFWCNFFFFSSILFYSKYFLILFHWDPILCCCTQDGYNLLLLVYFRFWLPLEKANSYNNLPNEADYMKKQTPVRIKPASVNAPYTNVFRQPGLSVWKLTKPKEGLKYFWISWFQAVLVWKGIQFVHRFHTWIRDRWFQWTLQLQGSAKAAGKMASLRELD